MKIKKKDVVVTGIHIINYAQSQCFISEKINGSKSFGVIWFLCYFPNCVLSVRQLLPFLGYINELCKTEYSIQVKLRARERETEWKRERKKSTTITHAYFPMHTFLCVKRTQEKIVECQTISKIIYLFKHFSLYIRNSKIASRLHWTWNLSAVILENGQLGWPHLSTSA